MSILDLLKQAQGGKGLAGLADQLGIDKGQADSLTEILGPAIGSAANKRAQSGGLESILGALKGEKQGGFFDDAKQAAAPEGQAQGMDFLKGIFGGQQQTEAVAAEAANKSGVDLETIMKMLPSLGAMAQGGMQKQMPDSAIETMIQGNRQQQQPQAQSGGLGGLLGSLLGGAKKPAAQQQGQGMDLSMLTNMLDANGDGSPLDDILGKFMK